LSEQGEVPDLGSRADLQFLALVYRRQLALGRGHVVFDLLDRSLGLGLMTVHDLPARRLRQVAPNVDDAEREHRADRPKNSAPMTSPIR
jgi:hypothetical protein